MIVRVERVVMDVLMAEAGIGQPEVIECTIFQKPLAIVVSGAPSVPAHCVFPAVVVSPNVGVEIARNNQPIMLVDLRGGSIQAIVKVLLVRRGAGVSWCIRRHHGQMAKQVFHPHSH